MSVNLLILSGCVSLKSVSVTQVPKERSQPIQASGSAFNFLGFTFDIEFADAVAEDLKKQCVGGQVQGILTKYETTAYFLVFKRTVTAQGYCVQ